VRKVWLVGAVVLGAAFSGVVLAPTQTSSARQTSTPPPPPPIVDAVGYLGCSNSTSSVDGYKTLGGNRLWASTKDYGTASVHVLATQVGSATSKAWKAFKSGIAFNPDTDEVWFQGCVLAGEDATLAHADALAVLAEIRKLIPGVTVYFSALNDWVAPHVCSTAGANGPADMRALRDSLVSEGEARLGPDMGSLISKYQIPSAGATKAANQTDPDGCHPNAAGKSYFGQRLLNFFTPPPVPTFTVTPTDPSGPDVTFEFTDAETAATFTCSLDAAASGACTSPYVATGLSDGPHTFTVRAVDGTTSAPASFTWTVAVPTPTPSESLPPE
jgi:hypothetical protein